MVYASNSMSSKSLSSSDDELHVSVSLSVGGGTLGITVIRTHRTVSRHLKYVWHMVLVTEQYPATLNYVWHIVLVGIYT